MQVGSADAQRVRDDMSADVHPPRRRRGKPRVAIHPGNTPAGPSYTARLAVRIFCIERSDGLGQGSR